MPTMSDVLEVRPGTVPPGKLAEFERALEPVDSTGRPAWLVGPDGITTELPEGIHSLLLAIVENLKAGKRRDSDPGARRAHDGRGGRDLEREPAPPHQAARSRGRAVPLVGTHRRLRLADVLAYRDRMDAQAADALMTMTAEAEELGLYDE